MIQRAKIEIPSSNLETRNKFKWKKRQEILNPSVWDFDLPQFPKFVSGFDIRISDFVY
jgi:hypothetical protein